MVLAAAAWCLCTSPPLQKPAETFDFVWRPRDRQVTRYRLSLNFDLPGTSMSLNAVLVQSVGRRDKAGAYEVSTSTKDVRVTTDADTQILPTEAPSIEKYDANGRRISRSEEPGDSFANAMGRGTDLLPPTRAVKVGEKWSIAVGANSSAGVPPCRLDYRFLGIDKRGKLRLLHLRYAFTETVGRLPVKADGYFYIDSRDFSIVECQSTMRNARISRDLPPAPVDVRMVRI